jgi:hypothetical protein
MGACDACAQTMPLLTSVRRLQAGRVLAGSLLQCEVTYKLGTGNVQDLTISFRHESGSPYETKVDSMATWVGVQTGGGWLNGHYTTERIILKETGGRTVNYEADGTVVVYPALSSAPTRHSINLKSLDFAVAGGIGSVTTPTLKSVVRKSPATIGLSDVEVVFAIDFERGTSGVRTISLRYQRSMLESGVFSSTPGKGELRLRMSRPGDYDIDYIELTDELGRSTRYHANGTVTSIPKTAVGLPTTHDFDLGALSFMVENDSAGPYRPVIGSLAMVSPPVLRPGNQLVVRAITSSRYSADVVFQDPSGSSRSAGGYSGDLRATVDYDWVSGLYTGAVASDRDPYGRWVLYNADGRVMSYPPIPDAPATHELPVSSLQFRVVGGIASDFMITGHPADVDARLGSDATFTVDVVGNGPFTYQWRKNGNSIAGATGRALTLRGVGRENAGDYSVLVSNADGYLPSYAGELTIATAQPSPKLSLSEGIAPAAGTFQTLRVSNYDRVAEYQWWRNGTLISGAKSDAYDLAAIQPDQAGLYQAAASRAGSELASEPIVVGPSAESRVIGAGAQVADHVRHPNGNHYDQVLLTGAAGAITADVAQREVTRTSFIDMDGDIVQVEFAGPGTLSLVLAGASGGAEPEKYHQPGVRYVKGHAGIVIVGATENTHVSVFTVGRATAFDPSGTYDILRAADDASNSPALNRSPLFVGHEQTSYDGLADLAFIAIASANGKFGSVRTANTTYFADRGYTGIYAPGVWFAGPVYVGNITAFADAQPVLILGSAGDVRITGGDLSQENGKPVQVRGVAQLKFTDGIDSHGRELRAQRNRAVLHQNGQDVTAQLVVNPVN